MTTRAFQQGREDYLYPSALRSRNPYRSGSDDAAQWDAGHAAAEIDVAANRIKWERGAP